MNNLGAYLKELRTNSGFSQDDIHTVCGITDSRLSRAERGCDILTVSELKKLAKQYKVNVVSLFLKTGLLDEEDLTNYQECFQNAGLLNAEERQAVQTMINLLTQNKVVKK